jgi:OOP family OmpA-OmpF porin
MKQGNTMPRRAPVCITALLALTLGGCASGITMTLAPVMYAQTEPSAPVAVSASAPAFAAASAPVPAAAPAPALVIEKVTYSADAFFPFNQVVLLPEGKHALDALAAKLKKVQLETVISTGYTDSFGPSSYNQKLSLQRAEAVKAYLVSRGIAADQIEVDGDGKTDFRVNPKRCSGSFASQVVCQTPNRRAVVEIFGSRRVEGQ